MANRNIFNVFEGNNNSDQAFDYDDGQSDIEVDQDRSIDLDEYSDANESVATNVGDLDYNLDLEVDEHSANESDTDSDDNLPTNAGDNDPRCRDGWSFDCAGASLNVRDFIEPTGPTFDLIIIIIIMFYSSFKRQISRHGYICIITDRLKHLWLS